MRRLLIVLSIAFLGISSSATQAHAQVPPPPPEPPVVVALGHAVIERAPDRAFVTFSTETRGAKPDDVQKQNAVAMTRVQDAVTKARVPADAVRTLGFNLQEEFDWANGKRVSRGYTASNSVEVRVDDSHHPRRADGRGSSGGCDGRQCGQVRPEGSRCRRARSAAPRGGRRQSPGGRRGRGRQHSGGRHRQDSKSRERRAGRCRCR